MAIRGKLVTVERMVFPGNKVRVACPVNVDL